MYSYYRMLKGTAIGLGRVCSDNLISVSTVHYTVNYVECDKNCKYRQTTLPSCYKKITFIRPQKIDACTHNHHKTLICFSRKCENCIGFMKCRSTTCLIKLYSRIQVIQRNVLYTIQHLFTSSHAGNGWLSKNDAPSTELKFFGGGTVDTIHK